MTSHSSHPTHPGAISAIEHPLLRRLGALLGWISLFATLALTGPGVVATANGEPVSEVSGPSCSTAQASNELVAIKLQQMMEKLRADADAHGDIANEVVVLDNRGFNYRPSPRPQAAPERSPER